MNYLSAEERKSLEYLYLEGAGHSRQMARELGLPPITASRILRRQLKAGILKEGKRVGNIREFSINYDSFRAIGIVCLIENERLNELAGRLPIKLILSELDALASFAALYGSAVRGPVTRASDIDILIISDRPKKLIVSACSRISMLSGIDLSPHILPCDKFFELVKSGEAFIVNTVLNPKNRVFLVGIDGFLKLVLPSIRRF